LYKQDQQVLLFLSIKNGKAGLAALPCCHIAPPPVEARQDAAPQKNLFVPLLLQHYAVIIEQGNECCHPLIVGSFLNLWPGTGGAALQ
jgi:hypothetical protein